MYDYWFLLFVIVLLRIRCNIFQFILVAAIAISTVTANERYTPLLDICYPKTTSVATKYTWKHKKANTFIEKNLRSTCKKMLFHISSLKLYSIRYTCCTLATLHSSFTYIDTFFMSLSLWLLVNNIWLIHDNVHIKYMITIWKTYRKSTFLENSIKYAKL